MQTFWLHYFTDSNVSSPEPVQISDNNLRRQQFDNTDVRINFEIINCIKFTIIVT